FEPAALRKYRLHENSLARRQLAKSEFELLFMGLTFKGRLLREAWRAPVPLRERMPFLGVALRNFLGDHLAWAHSVRSQIRTQEDELAMLAAAAEGREALIRRSGEEPPPHPSVEPVVCGSRRSLGPFSRPGAGDIAYLGELKARVGDARRACDALLAAIQAAGGGSSCTPGLR